MDSAKIKKIFNSLERHYKDNTDYDSNLSGIMDVLIATKLSQNTTDRTSYIAFRNLKDKFSNWENVMNARVSDIRKEIKICGLSEIKASDIKNMLKEMMKKHNTLDIEFLRDMSDDEIYEELTSYKGIGYKTVTCVLAFAMNRDVFPVDTHVHRVMNRLGIVKTNLPEKTFTEAKKIIPDGKKQFLHRAFIKFGRNICMARNPLCSECFLEGLCEYPDKNLSPKNNSVKKKNDFLILDNI